MQESVENRSHMSGMLFYTLKKKKNIMHVDKDKPITHISEYYVNWGLEDSGGIGQPKEYHLIFIMTL